MVWFCTETLQLEELAIGSGGWTLRCNALHCGCQGYKHYWFGLETLQLGEHLMNWQWGLVAGRCNLVNSNSGFGPFDSKNLNLNFANLVFNSDFLSM